MAHGDVPSSHSQTTESGWQPENRQVRVPFCSLSPELFKLNALVNANDKVKVSIRHHKQQTSAQMYDVTTRVNHVIRPYLQPEAVQPHHHHCALLVRAQQLSGRSVVVTCCEMVIQGHWGLQ